MLKKKCYYHKGLFMCGWKIICKCLHSNQNYCPTSFRFRTVFLFKSKCWSTFYDLLKTIFEYRNPKAAAITFRFLMMYKLEKNKIAQGNVKIFSHLTLFSMTFFAPLTRNNATNRLNIIIFIISRSISVVKDTSLAFFKKNCFWRPFWIFF